MVDQIVDHYRHLLCDLIWKTFKAIKSSDEIKKLNTRG